MFEQLGLVGCGLMGGSFALALKEAGLVKRIVGYSKSPSSSARAQALGIIDAAVPSPLEAAQGSDIVLLAVPVASTEACLCALRPALTPSTLLMDVGSTKCDVIAAAKRALGQEIGVFVPAHPIAGKERSGIDQAEATLYQQRKLILTPDSTTHPAQLEQARSVWEALGCTVLQMSAQEHDAAFAAVSHLPHLLAFAMVNGLTKQAHGAQYLALAGSGFRDFTRIAASEPQMWRDILLANAQELLTQSKHFQDSLHTLEAAIASGDAQALEHLIQAASQVRANWGMGGDNSVVRHSSLLPQP